MTESSDERVEHSRQLDSADLDRLIDLLGTEQLAVAGNRIIHHGHGRFEFKCEFERLSQPYEITTNDPEVVLRLLGAVVKNRRRSDYRQAVRMWRLARPREQGQVAAEAGIIEGQPLSDSQQETLRAVYV